MWCERFVSAYRGTPADRLHEHYGHASVLVETTGDGRWTEPVSGARDIAARLAELGPAVNGWPLVACQRTRPDGLIVATQRAAGSRDRQILVVRRSAAAAGGAVVRNHFYVAGGRATDARRPPFRGRFERWAGSLDRAALHRHRAALHAGLFVVRECYASADGRARWRRYDPEARFSCARDGAGGARVSVGPRDIRRRYAQLALDYAEARPRAVETCWSVAPDAVAVLVAGAVPGAARAAAPVDREVVQFFVIDARTRKILNDVLFVDGEDDGDDSRLAARGDSRPSRARAAPRPSSSSSSPVSLSSLSSTTGCSSGTSAVDAARSSSGYDDTDVTGDDVDGAPRCPDELVELRARLTANGLKIRHRVCNAGQPPQQSNSLNPRQLFIGCVPLHVKYGQLKLLFEQFGEVTYVKVYESYSKQTGAKMMHNYAFLFFKNEASVDRAIAASPVPLDSNWNLNVSRPLRHTTPAADER